MTYSDDDLRLDEMEFENITIDQHGPIAVLTVNRPKALNALNGTTLSELAMAADLIANDPEVGALIVTGAGDKAFVAGADISETARQIGAEEALSMGLVNYVADDPLQKAREVAEQIVKNGPLAISLVKEAVRRGLATDLEAGMEIEADLFGLAFATSDFKEGTKAFLEKRPAEFKGE